MIMYLVGGFMAGLLVASWFVRKKTHILQASIESLRYFASRARNMQDLWYEETGDPFIMVGGDGNIHSMNPAARRLVGALVEPVAGRPLSAFLKKDCEVMAAVIGALEDGKPVRSRAVKIRPTRSVEASRAMALKIVEVSGRREAWVLLGLSGA